ncbi:exodeoxyribonuclease V subunit alpha [Novilysobacter selenitireducens]|uniref:RecBCD enzyme subunit RecD n=1 Tax=Novilysobacter selenitireducens TaxID=2872639 RepID=A0ABS7T259_9GAMM|nr:exodeoxyribonuclease V subunit alpha [Lysobacter selenitireducens]MBZ4037951.1 exodeoxyribonuclease V subunit alpha [Lysobacter selenitireducens]
MSLMQALTQAGALRTLDHAFAQSLRRLDSATPDAVLAAAALASLAVAHGHAAFDPAQPALLVEGDIDWPAPEAWRAALAGSPWVARPDVEGTSAAAPLVLEDGLLYLRRYREYEYRLAKRLAHIAATAPDPFDDAMLAPVREALFPAATADTLQARAASRALATSLLLVTGGPGTGKTTTIARLLVLLVAQAALSGRPVPRIALAAPTGRAAERMAESLRAALERLRGIDGIDPAWLDALPDGASTLHRLLGTIPGSPRFRFDADTPLPFDLVVVDEASMVDLPLMCKLADAVPDGARLVLLGDPDQLPSVEAGDVLASICEAAGDDEHADVDAAPPVLVQVSPGETADLFAAPVADSGTRQRVAAPLQGHRVHLRRGFRQAAHLDLAPLADAVRAGDADGALALLRGGTLQGVHFHEGATDPLAVGAADLLPHWRALAATADPAQALAAAARLRLLTALRRGPQGAQALNTRIEAALGGSRATPHFDGRLLQVTENSYRHRLFNGDLGVCLRDDRGVPVAWFADTDGGVRAFHPSTLPMHESAFATTVHKAQGSEFDSVWLLLPQHDARPLSRELVYTALTRARSQVHVCASEAVLRAALARRVARISHLAARLGAMR